jgi:hypothetical protein
MSEDNVVALPTDQAIAAEIRAELAPLLDHVAAIMNRGQSHGLKVGFSIGLDQYGRHRPTPIDITRPL